MWYYIAVTVGLWVVGLIDLLIELREGKPVSIGEALSRGGLGLVLVIWGVVLLVNNF